MQFPNVGHLHPATQVREDLETFFSSMGFVIADGPELESEYYNFTALNIPPTHPARDMQDTFYVKDHPGMSCALIHHQFRFEQCVNLALRSA